MANKTFNTRIKLKTDLYANWAANDPVLLDGEAAVVVVPAATGAVQQEPATLLKIGDGVKKFSQLDFIGAKSADIYDWAKAATKPGYTANEISGLGTFISDYVDDVLGITTDTDHEYKITKINERQYKLMGRAKGDTDYTLDCGTIDIPETVYTLVTGTANGTVKFNGKDVAVKGLGSAAYTTEDSYDKAGAASKALEDAKTYADGKDTAISAAQSAADKAQNDVNALSGKVGAVPSDKTVVQMIADAKSEATYDDTALKNRVSTAEGKLDVLNGTGEGSVQKTANDAATAAINKFATDVTDNKVIDSYKELIDYVAEHGPEAAEMAENIQSNKTDISNLKTQVGTGTVDSRINAAKSELTTEINKKVTAEAGKGLSTNDYTDAEKNKLADIAEGAQKNVIETVKVNGTALIPDAAKSVNVTVPTGALASKNTVAKADLASALKTEIEGKLDASAVTGDLLTHNASEFAKAGHDHDTVYSDINHNHDIDSLTQTDYIVLDCGTSNSVI